MFRTCTISLLVILFANIVPAATSDDVAESIADLVREQQIVGAQLVLGDIRNVLMRRSFGTRNVSERQAVNDDTLFCIGSCSKMLAAAVVMTLVADGKLELDVPIDRWLSDFSVLKHPPTLRQLLCHRAGIYSQRDRMTPRQIRWIRDFRLTLKESVEGIAREKLMGEPGAQYRYSGAGYCVLGRVAEVAAGKPFEQLLQERICHPLRMKNTTFFPPADRRNMAVGHLESEDRFVVATNTPHLLGASLKLPLVGGSIYSTTSDLARFAQMMLNRGRHEGRPIIQPKLWSEMAGRQSPRSGGGYGFGIGVRTNESQRPMVLSHGGALSGSYSYMIMNLQTGRFGLVTYTGRRSKIKVAAIVATWVDPKPPGVSPGSTIGN